MDIYTVGHSDYSQEHFLNVLQAAEIQFVADIRAFPASRKHPQFKQEVMEQWLNEAGIGYSHYPLLGGRRSRSGEVGETLNAGWDNRSFHNYADYTLTDSFKEGLATLESKASKLRLAYMCSERHPARCHRLLVSNCLQAKGWRVVHIIDQARQGPQHLPHELGKWGAMPIIEQDGTIVYPELGEQ